MKKIVYLIALAGLVLASCAKPTDNPNNERKYPFSIGANKEVDNNNSAKTRIEIINEDLHWSVGDKIGMFIGYYQSSNPIVLDDFAMTGQHSEPVTAATFKGDLSYEQISKFLVNNHYTYTSYYPYDMWVGFTHVDGDTQDEFKFEIPYEMELTPNVFPSQYALMYTRLTEQYLLTWLESNGEQRFLPNPPQFHYQHVLSYLRLKVINNAPNNPVIEIFMESDYPNINISDIFDLHLGYGSVSTDRSHPRFQTRMIPIPDGLNVGDELYIPMVPSYYSANITFSFALEDGTIIRKVVRAMDNPFYLDRGEISTITFNLGYTTTHDSNTLEDLEDGSEIGIIN